MTNLKNSSPKVCSRIGFYRNILSECAAWATADEDPEDESLWEDNWDDDNINDDFVDQLREQLRRVDRKLSPYLFGTFDLTNYLEMKA